MCNGISHLGCTRGEGSWPQGKKQRADGDEYSAGSGISVKAFWRANTGRWSAVAQQEQQQEQAGVLGLAALWWPCAA